MMMVIIYPIRDGISGIKSLNKIMDSVYKQNNKILTKDNKIGNTRNCCCDCPKCEGSTCCSGEYPRQIGYCCENVWRLPTDIGGCCSGIWYDTAGTCCSGVWYTESGICCNEEWHAESGVCCGTTWVPTPEGVSLPVWPNPYNPFEPYPGVSWETEICPSGTLFAIYGKYGECCGCVPTGIYDPSVGYEVPWADISPSMCCSCTNTPYVDEYGCLGNCCVEGDCTTVTEQQCNPFAHPTNPTYIYEDYWKYLWEPNCCSLNRCSVDQCCANGRLVNRVTFAVTGDIISTPEGCGGDVPCGSTWILDPGFDIELDDPLFYGPGVEQKIFAQIGWNVPEEADLEMVAGTLYNLYLTALLFSYYGGQPSSWGVNGNTITISGPSAINGTITYIPPLGQTVVSGPTSSTSISRPECIGLWGGWPIGDPPPFWSNGWENEINCPCRSEEIGFQQSEIVEKCCRTVKSSGLGLTFTKPNTNGYISFKGTAKVTVTGTTTSPILVHGTLFGANATPEKKCPFQHTFVLCDGRFNIEPVPCGSSFHNLEVEVCYEKHAITSESFNFSGCNNIQVNLGSCPASCTTTMNYAGPGHTSNATILLTGNAIITANGTGPLVLTGNITPVASCVETLTLTGTSTAANKIAGVIGNTPAGLSVRKTGVGTWWLASQNTYTGGLIVLNGTLIAAANKVGGKSPFGGNTMAAIIGDETATTGTVALLLASGVTIEQSITVTAGVGQQVELGGIGSGTFASSQITLGRNVTLRAATGSTVTFLPTWVLPSGTSPTVGFTIGSSTNAGTVVFGSSVASSVVNAINVAFGALLIDINNPIARAIPLTLGTSASSVTFDLRDFSQRLANISFVGPGSEIASTTAGQLRLENFGGAVALDVAGTGHEISARVSLEGATTITGDGDLLISGVVSGSSGVTMDGGGKVTLSGANTYTGTTTINNGTMKAESLTAFGTGDIVVNAGGTLNKNGFAITNTITNNGGIIIN